ncbi:MAG: hypothetical protein H0U67_09555 [Gemmatimonadetes bacterium]|nr:hypothetical protein [Gemmatimonadota bacterium]MBA4158217.1 hypothetical protein [Gemmatimonadota bacterium]
MAYPAHSLIDEIRAATRGLNVFAARYLPSYARGHALLNVIACTGLFTCSFVSNAASQLHLAEESAYILPDSFPVTAMAALDNGRIGLLSNRDYVLIAHRGSFAEVGVGVLRRPVGIGVNPKSGRVEVVDAQRREIVSLLPAEGVNHRRLTVPIAIGAAVRVTGGWYVGGSDGTEVRRVFYVPDDGRVRQVHSWSSARRPSGQPAARLSALDDRVIITEADSPFHSVIVDSAGRLVSRLEAPDPDDASIQPAQRERRWSSLPVLRAGFLFLQVVSDLASDTRLVMTYDESGTLLRVAEVGIPIGFGATIPEHSLLVGIRRFGPQEIVSYRWSWGARRSQLEQ